MPAIFWTTELAIVVLPCVETRSVLGAKEDSTEDGAAGEEVEEDDLLVAGGLVTAVLPVDVCSARTQQLLSDVRVRDVCHKVRVAAAGILTPLANLLSVQSPVSP